MTNKTNKLSCFIDRWARQLWYTHLDFAASLCSAVLGSFHRQTVSVALQRAQAASISRHAITAGEGSFRLGVLSGLPPLSLVDMLPVTGGGFGA